MNKGQKVELKTFNGRATPTAGCISHENYWKLIGITGTLINFAQELGFPNENRVLIQFDIDVVAEGLECHNEKPNALWILTSDLKEISG